MVENKESIEKEIIKAARKVFISKGYEGARIREIATEAGVNFSLVNYHYQSKDNLFAIVFDDIFDKILNKLSSILGDDTPIFDKIRQVVSLYIDTLLEDKDIPVFIISELARNPERLKKQILSKHLSQDVFTTLSNQIKSETEAGVIKDVNPVNLFLNIASLCIFPILARPVAESIFSLNDEQYEFFLKSRKKEVADFIISSIKTPHNRKEEITEYININ